MSANRDKNQNIRFVYSNLYELYNKGKAAAKAADLSRVIKAEDMHRQQHEVHRRGFEASKLGLSQPGEMIGKRISKPKVLSSIEAKQLSVSQLKENLKTLHQLQARLRFMLAELEQLSQRGQN